jgi:hypothetical protein
MRKAGNEVVLAGSQEAKKQPIIQPLARRIGFLDSWFPA